MDIDGGCGTNTFTHAVRNAAQLVDVNNFTHLFNRYPVSFFPFRRLDQ